MDDTAAREFALTPYANLLGLIRADARESRYERIDPEAPSSVSPSSSAPAPPPPEEEPNWFGIGADGILRIGSAATDWSQGWLWEDPDNHKLRFIHQKPPAKAPGKGE